MISGADGRFLKQL